MKVLSHPTRVRGLKPSIVNVDGRNYSTVAPHAGAWIETLPPYYALAYIMVAPHAGAWIETFQLPYLRIQGGESRTPRGCVD